MRSYEEIKKEIVDIGGVVDMLPENIKEKAFDLLISTFIGDKSDSNNQKSISNPSRNTSYILDNIAEITNDGNFKFIVRDPKAKNKKDAAKRLIYVAIRAYNLLTKESGLSRKEVMNPILNEWNLNTGNTRGFINNDKGLIKSGDILSLDKVAEREADKFISQINDRSFSGTWKPK